MREHGVELSSDTTVSLRREFTAAPEKIQRALTDAAELTSWFWPARLSPRVTADARTGGRFRIAGGGDDYAMAVSGQYRLVAERQLEFTWAWDGDSGPETLVTIELSGMDGGGTLLELTHIGFPDQATRDDHITGWTDCLDRLRDRVPRDRTVND